MSKRLDRIEKLEKQIALDTKEMLELAQEELNDKKAQRVKYLLSIKDQPLKDIRELCAPGEYDDEKWRVRADYLDDIAELNGIKNCQYSCYENDLATVAVPGKVLLSHSGWEDEEYTAVYESPTWLDIWKFADIAMYKVDDAHHCFLEGIYKGKFENIYHVSMGS